MSDQKKKVNKPSSSEVEEKKEKEAEEKDLEIEPSQTLAEEPSESIKDTVDLAEDSKINSFKKLFWIILLAILLLGALAGGVFIYKEGIKKAEKAEEQLVVVSPSPIPTETPEASPAAEFKREDLKLQVLNGAGVAGTAAKAKEFLEELGYKDIEVGNADSYDYKKTVIKIKEKKKDYLPILTDDLQNKYSTESIQVNLNKESKFDVIVIIGKE